jgi:hypothetical protein
MWGRHTDAHPAAAHPARAALALGPPCRLVPIAALGSKIEVYRSALVLVIPSLLLAHGERRAPITISFAASDPYLRQRSPPPAARRPPSRATDRIFSHGPFSLVLSRVSELGTESLHSSADLAALAERLRAGALLLSSHPREAGLSDRELEVAWVSVRRALEHAPSQPGLLPPAVRRLDLLPAAHFRGSGGTSPLGTSPIGESSAADPAEMECWAADAGTPEAPGAGSAALQLQSFLDGVCGGWSNSFG